MDFTTNRIVQKIQGMDIRLAALVVQFLVSLAFSLMGSFLPLFIETDLNYPLIEATYWTGIAQLISSSLYAFTAPFWGTMCDRAGIRKITVMILVANGIVYAGMAGSTDIPHILLFQALQGSFGGVSTTMFTLVAAVVPENEMKKALSYQMAMMTMGSLVGPGVGGLLAEVVGYRLTFVASSLLFVAVIPLMLFINVPHPAKRDGETTGLNLRDLRDVLPDIVSLVMVYACISFITPTIPWFLKSLGVQDDQLLTYTAASTILNGAAFVVATPLLTRVVTDRFLPLLSTIAAGAIFATGFAADAYQFIGLRIAIGAIQSGIPPSLLGGRASKKRGAVMGFLNSARFLGMAVGPFMATSILGGGEPPGPLMMFVAMAGLSLVTSLVLYLSHGRKSGLTAMPR
ncbi:MFS transporter [Candidatus Bathyarchaeota archaeon]|nr:MFS transporter [Candidatus Bathyarchaeota archaeon]